MPFSLGENKLGWSSGHHPQLRGPESWSTACVYHFAHALDRLVAEGIRRSVFEYLDVPYLSPGQPKSNLEEFAPNFLDCPIKGGHRSQLLRTVLFKNFVSPIAKEARKVEDGGSLSSATPMSAIFFGPPGTSKTELTKQISEFMRWPLLTVDPSYFVRNGLDRIQAEADRLFNMLAASERIVVLLDEFDEMVRDRTLSTEILSRFLTTAMLPKLATINKSRRLVFIVATNYIGSFDLAISRRGRFDVVIQIMPPTFMEKLKRWPKVEKRLEKFNMTQDKDIKDNIARLTFDEFKALVPRLLKANNSDAIRRDVETAAGNCTMNAKLDIPDKTVTWETACTEQEAKIRIPATH